MDTPAPAPVDLPDPLRLTACLVHALPGCIAHVTTTSGGRLVVGHGIAGADLDPCRLRVALSGATADGCGELARAVRSISVVGGAVDLGGGRYERRGPRGQREQWFATLRRPGDVEAVAARCPVALDDGAVEVRAGFDALLAAGAVRMAAGRGADPEAVEEAMAWLHAACLVEDLLIGCGLSGPGAAAGC